MLESYIEKKFCEKVKSLGGLCEKFVSPARRSVPDRLVSLPGGRIIFVELKAPGKFASKAQMKDHRRRRELGFEVMVIDSLEMIEEFPNVKA